MTTLTTTTNPKTAALVSGRNVGKLDDIVSQCSLTALAEAPRFERAVILAAGIRGLRSLLTGEMMSDVMALQNTALGFRTDKPGGYDEATVREALIEATLRGVYPVGNEFNIIAGRCYVTKEGFTRLLREYPGLSNLRLDLGIPQLRDGGAIVRCKATWTLDGQPDELECEIPIRVNQGMGADAILGKAERKLRARVWNRLTGSVMATPDADPDDAPMLPGAAAPAKGIAAVKDRLGIAQQQATEPAEPIDALLDDVSDEPTRGGRIDMDTGEVVDDDEPTRSQESIDAETYIRTWCEANGHAVPSSADCHRAYLSWLPQRAPKQRVDDSRINWGKHLF